MHILAHLPVMARKEASGGKEVLLKTKITRPEWAGVFYSIISTYKEVV
jgi:hypothetical protein